MNITGTVVIVLLDELGLALYLFKTKLCSAVEKYTWWAVTGLRT